MKKSKSETVKAKKNLITDSGNYIEIITGCMSEEEKKLMNPHHLANLLALVADMSLTHVAAIAEAFEKNFGLEITFKAKLAPDRDTVSIQFKPVSEMKDSASATVSDPDQDEFEFDKKKNTAKGHESDDLDIKLLPSPKKKKPLTIDVAENE